MSGRYGYGGDFLRGGKLKGVPVKWAIGEHHPQRGDGSSRLKLQPRAPLLHGKGNAGEKHVAVKMADLKRGKDNRLVLNTTKDALKQMASYDLNFDAAAKSGSSTQK